MERTAHVPLPDLALRDRRVNVADTRGIQRLNNCHVNGGHMGTSLLLHATHLSRLSTRSSALLTGGCGMRHVCSFHNRGRVLTTPSIVPNNTDRHTLSLTFAGRRRDNDGFSMGANGRHSVIGVLLVCTRRPTIRGVYAGVCSIVLFRRSSRRMCHLFFTSLLALSPTSNTVL